MFSCLTFDPSCNRISLSIKAPVWPNQSKPEGIKIEAHLIRLTVEETSTRTLHKSVSKLKNLIVVLVQEECNRVHLLNPLSNYTWSNGYMKISSVKGISYAFICYFLLK